MKTDGRDSDATGTRVGAGGWRLASLRGVGGGDVELPASADLLCNGVLELDEAAEEPPSGSLRFFVKRKRCKELADDDPCGSSKLLLFDPSGRVAPGPHTAEEFVVLLRRLTF